MMDRYVDYSIYVFNFGKMYRNSVSFVIVDEDQCLEASPLHLCTLAHSY